MVLGGAIFYDATDVKSLIQTYAHYAAAAPDELTTEALLMYAPPAPFLPQAQQGKLVFAIQLCYSGDLAEDERVVTPLRALRTPIADLVAPMPYPAIFPPTEDDPMRGFEHVGRSLFLETLNDEALDTLAQEAVVFMAPGIAVQLRFLGVAMGRVPADATAFAHLHAPETKRQPSALFGKLRAEGTLSYVTGGEMGFWITTTYEDAIAILNLRSTGLPQTLVAYISQPTISSARYLKST